MAGVCFKEKRNRSSKGSNKGIYVEGNRGRRRPKKI